jgi:Transposase DDE domain
VAGQDVEQGTDGMFRISRGVARDRVLSTVDTEARHGHKSRARTFDGYKAHLATDPDDELITNVTVTPANTADRDAVEELLTEPGPAGTGGDDGGASAAALEVFGDSAYADGATLDKLAAAGHEVHAKVPPVRNPKGYSKDEFTIDTQVGTVGCPAGHTAQIRPRRHGGQARFRPWCAGCPLRTACTTSRSGRVITIHPHEAHLQQAKTAQRDPAWQQAYRRTQDRALHPTAVGRASRPLSGPGPDPHRRPHPRRSDQPRQPRRPRSPIHPGRMGHRLSGPPRPLPTRRCDRRTPARPAPNGRNALPNRTHEPSRAQPHRSPAPRHPGRSP